MIDDNEILPLDGGDVPDDRVLKERILRAYAAVPASDERMVARCVRLVLEHVTAEYAVPKKANGASRRIYFIGAAAVAAALLISVTLRKPATTTPEPVTPAAVATNTAIAGGIQFDLRIPKGLVANVSVVGDFNGWDSKATPMVKDPKSGEWSAKIVLLPGRYIYAYVVNGEKWIVDPLKPQIPDAGYGPANAVVVEEASK